MHSLTEVFDAPTVARLAGPRVYPRGVHYLRERRAGPSMERDGRLEATVRGTMPYIVQLWADGGKPQWSCTCPAAEDGSFCKHCTAVALSIGPGDDPSKVPPLAASGRAPGSESGSSAGPAPDDELAGFVEGLAQHRLAEIVLDRAVTDWTLRARLLAEARAARGDGPDLGAWRLRIDNAFAPYGDFVTYREATGWAEGVNEVIDAIEDLGNAGHNDAAARLAEHAHRRADESIEYVDDSDGWLSTISSRLGDVHHEACTAGRPDPVELAARLVELELASDLDGFYQAAADYAEVLGDEGLAAYREHLLPRWRPTGPRTDDWSDSMFSAHRAMVGWAIGTGDPDALIDVLQQDRMGANDALRIVRALEGAGRRDEAIEWARRRIAENNDRLWPTGQLREFLARALRGRGEPEAAVDVFWQAFVSHPSLAAYRSLLDEAAKSARGHRSGSNDGSEQARDDTNASNQARDDTNASNQARDDTQAHADGGWLQRCEEELHSRLSRHAGHDDDRSARSTATPQAAEALAEILAYEGRLQEAWDVAAGHGCAESMWMTLARAREKTHPLDAIGVYEPRVLSLIDQKRTPAYKSAVELMGRVRRLADAAGEPDRFMSLLERVRTEHRAKRNLKALLDARGW